MSHILLVKQCKQRVHQHNFFFQSFAYECYIIVQKKKTRKIINKFLKLRNIIFDHFISQFIPFFQLFYFSNKSSAFFLSIFCILRFLFHFILFLFFFFFLPNIELRKMIWSLLNDEQHLTMLYQSLQTKKNKH